MQLEAQMTEGAKLDIEIRKNLGMLADAIRKGAE